ncbi:MAG: hypothetical protein GX776_02145 [Oxalobacter sp.]|nr:hypothetical protein [Oxalobacter sp.]
MSAALAALISSITNGAAVFKVRSPQSPISFERKRLLNDFLSQVRESDIYDDADFSLCVDEVLQRQGYYFRPCGNFHTVPEMDAA